MKDDIFELKLKLAAYEYPRDKSKGLTWGVRCLGGNCGHNGKSLKVTHSKANFTFIGHNSITYSHS